MPALLSSLKNFAEPADIPRGNMEARGSTFYMVPR